MLRLLLLLAGVSLLHGQVSDLKRSAISELRAEKYSDAKDHLDQALKLSPNDPSLWTLHGFALSHLNDRNGALASYNRALGIAPDYLAALEGAAELQFAASDQHAVPLLERLIKLNPSDQTAHAMLAGLAYQRKDCNVAAREFQQAQSLITSQPQALEQYGYCLLQLKKTAEAIPVFNHLLDLQPQSDRARYNLAVIQSADARYRDVIATLTGPGEALPKNPDALDLLAQTYESVGDTPHAVAALRQAIVTRPDVPKYYLDFANISLAHSAFQVGIDMINAGLERLPNSGSLYLARGILYIQLGQYDQSEQDFARAEKLDPTLQYGSSAQGLAKLQQNDLTEAETTVRDRLRKHPNDPFLHYLLAETLARSGAAVGSPEFIEAVKAAREAVRLQPDFSLARDVLGRLYLQEGKTSEAIEQSKLAFQADPADQTALYHLIMALRKGGKTSEIPPLAKKLADLREQARLKEAAEHKFALVDEPAAGAPKPR